MSSERLAGCNWDLGLIVLVVMYNVFALLFICHISDF